MHSTTKIYRCVNRQTKVVRTTKKETTVTETKRSRDRHRDGLTLEGKETAEREANKIRNNLAEHGTERG